MGSLSDILLLLFDVLGRNVDGHIACKRPRAQCPGSQIVVAAWFGNIRPCYSHNRAHELQQQVQHTTKSARGNITRCSNLAQANATSCRYQFSWAAPASIHSNHWVQVNSMCGTCCAILDGQASLKKQLSLSLSLSLFLCASHTEPTRSQQNLKLHVGSCLADIKDV